MRFFDSAEGEGTAVPEDKVQAQFQKVQVATGLGIDSPMVVFHTDLETLGLTGGGTSSTGAEPSGGGTSASSSSSGSGDDTPPLTTAAQVSYIAMCDRVQHTDGAGDGVIDGVWFGAYSPNFDEAEASALAHEDGFAFVAFYSNGVLVGPVARH